MPTTVRTTARATDALLRAQASLTGRDLTLLGWLYDHKVLTTPQVAASLFPSLDFAQRRLRRLHQLGVVDRFRPQRWDGGSHPYHWVLGQLGHDVVAGQRQDKLPRRDRARTVRAHLTSRANLPHRLAVNQFFIDLAAHQRLHPDTALWWPSPEPYQKASGFLHDFQADQPKLVLWRGAPHPDGWGSWRDSDREVTFFADGTETIDVLTDKITRYDVIAAHTAWRWPILFLLPTLRREHHLHSQLWDSGTPIDVPVATTARDLLTATGRSPGDAVWQLHGHDSGRVRLIALPHTDAVTADFNPRAPAST